MPDSRFEKLTRSVIESDHPIFSKVRKELPRLSSRSRDLNQWKSFWNSLNERFRITPKLVALAMALTLSILMYRPNNEPKWDYSLGDVVQKHIVAPRGLEIFDNETTEAKKKTALANVLTVYDYDPHVLSDSAARIHHAFSTLRRRHEQSLNFLLKRRNQKLDSLANNHEFQDLKHTFVELLGSEVSDSQFYYFLNKRFSPALENQLAQALERLNYRYIVSDRELLSANAGPSITIKHLEQNPDESAEIVLRNLDSVLDISGAKATVSKDLPLDRFIVPNLTLNRQETEQRRYDALQNIKPVVLKFAKGEVILRAGETVGQRQLSLLRQVQKIWTSEHSILQVFATAIFLFILTYAFYAFAKGGFRRYRYTYRDIAVFMLLMTATVLAMKGIQFLAVEALMDKFPQLPLDFYYFLVPIAAAPVVIRMITVKEPALVFSFMLGVIGGLIFDNNFFYACYVFASSLTAVSLAHRIKTRGVIYKAGLLTGLVNIVLIACIEINTHNAAHLSILNHDWFWIVWAGMLSGFFVSVLSVSLLPLIELLFGHTSDLRLLELANMNHPLLRDLMVKAPGTYHHSIVIGSLVEAGAEAIGANPLLARVMAYYHDVGKMERPLYFIENQGGGYNRHDSLQPHMSAMIIREHVKKGQELGRKFKLPQPLIDAMSEHHGSSTIWYFYNKAKSGAADPDGVLESDYKYDGQKPQSKETALVMLGDVVEAATRSIADPTPLRLSGVVKNILNKYFAEGQLSECDLTLRDLDLIASGFLDVLLGIYHARIEYNVPNPRDLAKKKTNAGSAPKANSRLQAGGGVAQGAGVTPISKAYQIPGSGGGGSQKR